MYGMEQNIWKNRATTNRIMEIITGSIWIHKNSRNDITSFVTYFRKQNCSYQYWTYTTFKCLPSFVTKHSCNRYLSVCDTRIVASIWMFDLSEFAHSWFLACFYFVLILKDQIPFHLSLMNRTFEMMTTIYVSYIDSSC